MKPWDKRSFSADEIRRHLEQPACFAITVEPQVTSTNTLLRAAAEDNAPEGTVLVAASQTAGRGRTGHSFWSPADTGVYFSVLLRPRTAADKALTLTAASAVAVARSIEAVCGKQADIQWVNDVYCANKKVCGILTESRLDTQSGGLLYAIVGVGINVAPPAEGFPEELRARAGSVLTAPPCEDMRSRLVAAFLNEFWPLYTADSNVSFLMEYRQRCLRLGRAVRVLCGTENRPAEVLDVTDTLALRVRFEDGAVRELTSGEVSIRLPSEK